MDLSEVTQDPDIAESVTVLRSQGGQFVPGGWAETKTQIVMYGVVTPADALTLDQVPEADRVKGSILFFTNQILLDTYRDQQNPNKGGTSDQLVWQGETYRVQKAWPYGPRGYWKAYCCRMLGE